jgi:signal transduction histidine kinase
MNALEINVLDRHCVLAHDINNKLASIIGYCELMADKQLEDPECCRRLGQLREIALALSKQVNGHHCRVLSSVGTADGPFNTPFA